MTGIHLKWSKLRSDGQSLHFKNTLLFVPMGDTKPESTTKTCQSSKAEPRPNHRFWQDEDG